MNYSISSDRQTLTLTADDLLRELHEIGAFAHSGLLTDHQLAPRLRAALGMEARLKICVDPI